MIEIPIAWILTAFGAMAATIAGLFHLFWAFVQSRFSAQDKVIDGLRNDVDRMSKGCGADHCSWRNR
jgi:hypothetical protein